MSTTETTTDTVALKLDDLHVAYDVRGIPRPVLRGVSFEIHPGEAYGLVGESGCGKSTTAYAAVRYLPENGHVTDGSITIAGQDMLKLSAPDLRALRSSRISMVYQDPSQSLNPTIKVGAQVVEAFTVLGFSKAEAKVKAKEALHRVRIADAQQVLDRYPYQLSGGMQQRVVIAMALACDPQLLILDEPTTGLDATVEAEVLDLVSTLRQETGAAVLLIAHNLGVVRRICDRVGVMYAGKIVEEGPAAEVFDNPQHPYTVGLLRCLPRRGANKVERRLDTIPGSLPLIGTVLPACVFQDRCVLATEECRTVAPPATQSEAGRTVYCHHADKVSTLVAAPLQAPVTGDGVGEIVLHLENVSKTFKQGHHEVRALVDVDLDLRAGETLGLVGESGSGKTTLAKAILGIHATDAGSVIELDSQTLAGLTTARTRDARRAIQIIFQNPDSALNRSKTVRAILERALQKLAGIRGQEAGMRLASLTDEVRLSPRHLDMRPRALSGGLKQRVAIAGAFAGGPRIVVCDEPTSALDVSVQAAILNLLADMQREEQASYIVISHDLGVVRYLSDRIAVLYLGRLMELGPAAEVFAGPHHPYTEALLSAVPSVDGDPPDRIRLTGELPSAINLPSGCVFHTRCPRAIKGTCEALEPPLVEVSNGHMMRCHIPIDELRTLQHID
ncbi:MAG: ABC transporter ATP-binding protein [Thermoleophilia bacterium]|nr:ABC transporter ATP-binding protein [Thermoleophilia bacterium]